MGLDPKHIPQNILRLMPKAHRAPLGKAGVTTAEATAQHAAREEKTLQDQMAALLRQRNLFFDWSRMDRKTTNRKGMPDFRIVLRGGKALMVEAKVPGGELSDAQREVFTEYWDKTGDVVHIVLRLEEFRELLDQKAA